MGNLLIYSAAVDFCIWPRALPGCRATTRLAPALDYPTRPVHLIEGFSAGGARDIIARLIGQALSERLGQSFVIENRAGASSNIAAEAVVRAPPDGYIACSAAAVPLSTASRAVLD